MVQLIEAECPWCFEQVPLKPDAEEGRCPHCECRFDFDDEGNAQVREDGR